MWYQMMTQIKSFYAFLPWAFISPSLQFFKAIRSFHLHSHCFHWHNSYLGHRSTHHLVSELLFQKVLFLFRSIIDCHCDSSVWKLLSFLYTVGVLRRWNSDMSSFFSNIQDKEQMVCYLLHLAMRSHSSGTHTLNNGELIKHAPTHDKQSIIWNLKIVLTLIALYYTFRAIFDVKTLWGMLSCPKFGWCLA